MNLKKETPQSLRVADIDHGTSYAVFLQNTPILWDAVPRVGTLGWYAMPRQGKLYDRISIPRPCPPSRALRSIGLVCEDPSGQIVR